MLYKLGKVVGDVRLGRIEPQRLRHKSLTKALA